MINRMKHTLQLDGQDVREYLWYVLNALGYEVQCGTGFVFGIPKGTCTPVLLQAHWDTYRTKKDTPVVLIEETDIVYNVNGILGGDDRAGVAGIIEVASQFEDKPFLLFTDGEEPCNGTPHWGMKEFIASELIKPYTDNIYMLLAMDRQGHNEYVTYDYIEGEHLRDWLFQCGYVSGYGSSSDIEDLQKSTGILCVNVSAGYYLQHGSEEFILTESYVHSVKRLTLLAQKITSKQLAMYRKSYGAGGVSFKIISKSPVAPAVGPPPPAATYTTVLNNMPCCMCTRTDRDIHYYPQIGEFICYVCRDKLIKEGGVNARNLATGKLKLEEEKRRTRQANRMYNVVKNHVHMPTCPVCGQSSNVHWSKTHIGFVCSTCEYRMPDGYLGIFWIRGNEKIFVQKKTCYHTTMDGRKLLKTESVYSSEVVKVCDCCKNACMNYTAYSGEGFRVMPTYLCKVCKDELADIPDIFNAISDTKEG